ncbi:MAG TPA: copper resistance protein NlpE N-terminal domain-containing protein [Gammaproteobacteria bacterium]
MRARSFAIVLPLFVAACGDAALERPETAFSRPAGPAPDVYSGVFPCDNCPGIETTLWLRADGTFFWRQRYLDHDGAPATTSYNLGRWNSDADGTLLLAGWGPPRRLDVSGPDALLLVTPSPAEHRLTRTAGGERFTDRVRIEGTAVVDDDTATISECRTGLSAPAGGADLRRFLRQYRSLGFSGKPAFVEIEARFEWADDGGLRSFAVDRFVTIKAGRTC